MFSGWTPVTTTPTQPSGFSRNVRKMLVSTPIRDLDVALSAIQQRLDGLMVLQNAPMECQKHEAMWNGLR